MQEITECIVKALKDYESRGLLVDKQFLYYIVDVFVNYYDLNDFILDVNFDAKLDGNLLAGYHAENKNIVIDYEKELIRGLNVYSQNNINFDKNIRVQALNYRLLGSIIHELTHAIQYKKCLTDQNDFETELLNYGMDKNLTIIRKGKLADNYTDAELDYLNAMDYIEQSEYFYLFCPHERMANLTDYAYEEAVSKYFSTDDYTKLNTFIKLQKLNYQLMPYDLFSPTAYIISMIEDIRRKFGFPTKFSSKEDVEKYFDKIAKNNKFNLEDRLYYGMDITNNEKTKLNNEYSRLLKKLK